MMPGDAPTALSNTPPVESEASSPAPSPPVTAPEDSSQNSAAITPPVDAAIEEAASVDSAENDGENRAPSDEETLPPEPVATAAGDEGSHAEEQGPEDQEPEAVAAIPEPKAKKTGSTRKRSPAKTTSKGSSKKSSKRRQRGPRSVLEEHRDILGVLPDAEVAQRVGLATGSVKAYRQWHNIPGPGQSEQPTPRPTPVVRTPTPRVEPVRAAPPRPAPPRSAGATYGWRITLAAYDGATERVVLAGNATAACQTGAQYGEVLSVTRLAEALG